MDFFESLRSVANSLARVSAKPTEQPNDDSETESNVMDPQEELRLKCGETRHITHLLDTLQECNDRVNARSQTQETCEQELFDYVHALDHFVAKTLMSRLV